MERYSLEQAQSEASKIKEIIQKDESKTYSDAEKVVDREQGIKELLSVFKDSDIGYVDSSKEISGAEINREYKLAEQAGISPAGFASFLKDNLMDLIREENEEILKLLETFQKRPLLDIGAGDNWFGYDIAKLLGARGYIAVEPYYGDFLARTLKTRDKFVVVKNDALTALRKIKDGSVNVMTSGTDDLMMQDDEYNLELAKEIARVVGDKGVFISYTSILKADGFGVRVIRKGGGAPIRVWQQKRQDETGDITKK